MIQKHKEVSVRSMVIAVLILINAIILRNGYIINEKWYWLLILSAPLLIVVTKTAKNKQKAKAQKNKFIHLLNYVICKK